MEDKKQESAINKLKTFLEVRLSRDRCLAFARTAQASPYRTTEGAY